MSKNFLPVLAVVFAAFVLMMVRPSIMLNSKKDPRAPYCLKVWLTTLVLLVVGGLVYAFVNQSGLPKINLAQMCGMRM